MSAGITIQGLEQAKRKVRLLDPKNHRGAERKGLKTAGNVLAESARRHAPVDTGRLRAEGITVKATVSGTKAEARVGTNRIGMFQELGTVHHAAQPFLRPAIEETKDEVAQVYGDAFVESVNARLGI